ncbi:MAG: NAD-binding protein [Myxococcota bacterium]
MTTHGDDDLKTMIRKLANPREDNTILVRLLRAAGLLFAVFIAGTFGYYFICDGEYDLLTCAYMTIITLTSIGYGEVIAVQGYQDRIVFTMLLVIVGMGLMLYFVSTLTAFIVDGELRDLLTLKRMKHKINRLSGHYIVAGLGDTGQYVFKEMVRLEQPCLLIERSRERVLKITNQYDRPLPYVIGDATDDATLVEAGIERARAVVFSLGNDRDNLFATLTARGINADVTIVTRGENFQSEQKFKHAGATSVIFTNELGGVRMAAEAIRPEVTSFLELMMRDHGEPRRIEEFELPLGSPILGLSLRELNLRRHTDALIIAIHDNQADETTFNPGPNFVIEDCHKLVMLILLKDVPRVEELLRTGSDAWRS